MTAEDIRVPVAAREQTIAPAFQRGKMTVSSVTGALDELCCAAERLRALLDSNIADMHELVVQANDLPESMEKRTTDIWMIFILAGEKLAELEDLIIAVTSKAYYDRQAAAA